IWKLKSFQDLGHIVIFLIGDFTAMVGDPSGKSKTRPRLTKEQVAENAKTYNEQVFKILDHNKTEIRFNSEWHGKRNIYDFLDLASRHTVHRMLERDDFLKRFKANQSISMLEFLYPLMQAYDSVALEADVEVGGNDQKFNLVLGRHILRAYNKDTQVVLLMPLIRGTDGNEKMSKSLANAIGITDEPKDMYGKIMSVSDELLEEYFCSVSGLVNDIIQTKLKERNPYEAKHFLAQTVVKRYHPKEDVEKLKENFLAQFRDKSWPSIRELVENRNIVKAENDLEWLPKLMVTAGVAKSNGEAIRLLKAGAVSMNEEKLSSDRADWEISLTEAKVFKVGKRRFFVVYKDEEQLK
ncbi:tyrosine--tRNA ligase, partial [bacterium]|nr:tyrosine--tRNA ligase [bacterium]